MSIRTDNVHDDDAWESTDDSDDAAEISFDVRRAAESRADRDDG